MRGGSLHLEVRSADHRDGGADDGLLQDADERFGEEEPVAGDVGFEEGAPLGMENAGFEAGTHVPMDDAGFEEDNVPMTEQEASMQSSAGYYADGEFHDRDTDVNDEERPQQDMTMLEDVIRTIHGRMQPNDASASNVNTWSLRKHTDAIQGATSLPDKFDVAYMGMQNGERHCLDPFLSHEPTQMRRFYDIDSIIYIGTNLPFKCPLQLFPFVSFSNSLRVTNYLSHANAQAVSRPLSSIMNFEMFCFGPHFRSLIFFPSIQASGRPVEDTATLVCMDFYDRYIYPTLATLLPVQSLSRLPASYKQARMRSTSSTGQFHYKGHYMTHAEWSTFIGTLHERTARDPRFANHFWLTYSKNLKLATKATSPEAARQALHEAFTFLDLDDAHARLYLDLAMEILPQHPHQTMLLRSSHASALYSALISRPTLRVDRWCWLDSICGFSGKLGGELSEATGVEWMQLYFTEKDVFTNQRQKIRGRPCHIIPLLKPESALKNVLPMIKDCASAAAALSFGVRVEFRLRSDGFDAMPSALDAFYDCISGGLVCIPSRDICDWRVQILSVSHALMEEIGMLRGPNVTASHALFDNFQFVADRVHGLVSRPFSSCGSRLVWRKWADEARLPFANEACRASFAHVLFHTAPATLPAAHQTMGIFIDHVPNLTRFCEDIMHKFLLDLWDLMPRKEDHLRRDTMWQLIPVQQRFSLHFIEHHMIMTHVSGLTGGRRGASKFDLFFPDSMPSITGRGQSWHSLAYYQAYAAFRNMNPIELASIVKQKLERKLAMIECLPTAAKDKIWKTTTVRGKVETHLYFCFNRT